MYIEIKRTIALKLTKKAELASFQNLVLNRKVSFFPFLTPILQNEADIQIPPFSRERFPTMLESAPFDKYKNKLAKIVLLDIKGRKITKYCLIREHWS